MQSSKSLLIFGGLSLSFLLAIGLVVACKTSHEEDSATQTFFNKSNDKLVLPENYKSLSAAEKQDILYKEMQKTEYSSLPDLTKTNPLQFILSHLNFKMENAGDEAPVGYVKSLHAHGVAAKVKFVAEPNSPYTGLLKGTDYGILRMSITADAGGKDFAPGIALKFLIDGRNSENISALYKLTGQGSNHNFFANELSNIIPVQLDPKSIFSSATFLRASINPTKLAARYLADVDYHGVAEAKPFAPVQLYFVPRHENDFSIVAHDFRKDLLSIPVDTTIYDVYATQEEGKNLKEIDEKRREAAVKIGSLVSTSPFLASKFGDSRLFFMHHRFEKR